MKHGSSIILLSLHITAHALNFAERPGFCLKAPIKPVLLVIVWFIATRTKMKCLGHRGAVNMKEFDCAVLLFCALCADSPVWLLVCSSDCRKRQLCICKCHNRSKGRAPAPGAAVAGNALDDVDIGAQGHRFVSAASGSS